MRRSRRRNRVVLAGLAVVCAAAGFVLWRHSLATSTEAAPPETSAPSQVAEATPQSQPAEVTTGQAESEATTGPVSVAEPASRPAAAVIAPDVPATAPVVAPVAPAPTTAVSHVTTMPVNAATAVRDAQVLVDQGELIAARRMLNQALISSSLSGEKEAAVKKLIAQINQTAVFSTRRLPGDEWIDAYQVQPGDTLKVLAPKYSLTTDFVQRINKITDAKKMRYGMTLKMLKGPFYAVVTKSVFTLDIYLGAPGGENSMYVCSFPVGLGQDDSTPTGRWEVAVGKKLTHPVYYDPRSQGVVYEGSDPNNPLGAYWIGLTGVDGEAVGKLSYGIHGTIEPDSVGKMSSMGCIRLRNDDVKQIYELLVEGKSIVFVK
jgi:lipoprotein-anchoring transpeptidase ErfK/SrfK